MRNSVKKLEAELKGCREELDFFKRNVRLLLEGNLSKVDGSFKGIVERLRNEEEAIASYKELQRENRGLSIRKNQLEGILSGRERIGLLGDQFIRAIQLQKRECAEALYEKIQEIIDAEERP